MKKKRGRTINIKINFSNRWLYFLITLGILAIVGVGVYAAQQASSGGTHSYAEIGLPSCSSGQVLKWSGGAWTCGTDIDTNTDYCSGGTCGMLTVQNLLQVSGGDEVIFAEELTLDPGFYPEAGERCGQVGSIVLCEASGYDYTICACTHKRGSKPEYKYWQPLFNG
jgi:hypothetical protein